MCEIKRTVVALAFCVLSAVATAQTSGTCGDGVEWEITGKAPNQ